MVVLVQSPRSNAQRYKKTADGFGIFANLGERAKLLEIRNVLGIAKVLTNGKILKFANVLEVAQKMCMKGGLG